MGKVIKVLSANVSIKGTFYDAGTQKKDIEKEHIEAIGENLFVDKELKELKGEK